MLSEKKIYDSWKKRFGYPTNPYEKKAERSLARVKSLKPTTFQKIRNSVKDCPVILVGDDAWIEEQNQMMLSLIASKGRRKAFITNRIEQKHQKRINRYLKGTLTLRQVLPTISIDPIQYDVMGKTLAFLKKNGIDFLAIGNQKSFSVEDRKIVQFCRKNIEHYDQIIVWTGHFRLPLLQSRLQSIKCLAIYLQSNHLRWKFWKKGGWQRFDQSFVWMNSSPLMSLDMYRMSADEDREVGGAKNAAMTVKNMMKDLSKKLRSGKYSYPQKIIHVFDKTWINQVKRMQKNKSLFAFVVDRIKNGESAAIPGEKMVLLSTLRLSHMAEEVAHYMRVVGQKQKTFGPYMTTLEEAWAYLASLLFYPKREIPALSKHPTDWDLVHANGYNLGRELYKKWNRSEKNREQIRKQWNFHPENERQAVASLIRLQNL